MGIKLGMAAFAASQGRDGGLFIPVKLHGGKPFAFAQMVYNWDERPVRQALRYPHGELGHLRLSSEMQLEIESIEVCQWVPTRLQMQAITGTLDSSQLVFDGNYEVKEYENECA